MTEIRSALWPRSLYLIGLWIGDCEWTMLPNNVKVTQTFKVFRV